MTIPLTIGKRMASPKHKCPVNGCEYRDALALVTGCRSTTDERMIDRGVDLALAYFEAINWRKIDAGELRPSGKPDAVFRQRGYWQSKNPSELTSRDRYRQQHPKSDIAALEAELDQLGCGPGYCAAIRSRVAGNRTGTELDYAYKTALERTLAAKRKKLGAVEAPF